MLINKYLFGDTAVYYVKSALEGHDDAFTVGLCLLPASVEVEDYDSLRCDSMVQVAFTGGRNLIDYTQGLTMRNYDSDLLTLDSQKADDRGVVSYLSDGKGNNYVHNLSFDKQTGVFSVSVTYENNTEEIKTLEMLESFSLSGIFAPSREEISTCGLTLHRMTAAWSRECRLKSDSFSHLGLDMSWARYGVKDEKWGQRGSMPVRDYFPFAAIEDEKDGFILGCIMEAPYSWQMEVYQEKETCSLSGGLGDYEFAHWRKDIMPGESFSTHKAYIKVAREGGVNGICNSLVHYMDSVLTVPESEQTMPVLFNEYCTTWGCPSEENITEILKAVEPLSIDYFVIDCGWYKPDDKGWCNAIGDWNQSKTLFPDGIKAVSDKIRAQGLKPGIWFEFEVAGVDSEIYYNPDYLIKRNGSVLSTKNRRFFDLRDESVEYYLNKKLLAFLRDNRFEYIKIDYNDTIGMGCDSEDGAEIGEGGRQLMEASLEWIDKIKDAIPGIVIENCSSGGGRIEPCRMNKVSMCSFSDAHECKEIPLVAANVSRIMPARQEQIWAVIRKEDDEHRIIWSMTSGMFGRICLSGDIWKVGKDKIDLIQDGIMFYKSVSDIVRYGDIEKIENTVEYYREPYGIQIYVKGYDGRKLVLVHKFERIEKTFEIKFDGYKLKNAYTDFAYTETDGGIVIDDENDYRSGAFEFVKE